MSAPEATAPPPTRPTARGSLPYFPGLEGLRGVAVAAVLLFHSGFEWMQGGYLGVSTFFTLSGFLITSLLLAERGATAGIDLRAFWRRRWRRLLPATFAAFALVLLYGVVAAGAAQKRNLAGDVLAAMAYVANWKFILSDQSYVDLFAAPSPVLHFWSLAIEEQFYLLYPLLAFTLLGVYRQRRQWFGLVLGGLALASFSLPFVFTMSDNRVYMGTDTRAAELLIGAILAVLLYQRSVTHRLAHDRRTRGVAATAGTIALALCAAAWVLVGQRTPALYHGGFSAYALLSSLVIVAAILPAGPVRWLLALGPVRYVGRISYGVYLYHWPVFLWIDEERTGLGPYALLVPRLAVTGALAVASYHLLEMPVRKGRGLAGVRPVRLLPVAVTAVAIAVVAISLRAPKPVIDFDQAQADLASVENPPPPPPPSVPDEPPFPRMAVFGDSTAMMTSFGLNAWTMSSEKAQFVDGAAWLGCGIGRGGERRSGKDEGPIPEHCNHWEVTWAQKVRDNKPNIAVVQIGPWEVADRKLEGDTVWRAPGDPVYDEYLTKEMTLAVDKLSAEGAYVVWLTSPPVGAGEGEDARLVRGQAAEPARMTRLNELISQLPSLRPGRVGVVDLASWLIGTGEDTRLRPDGVHFGPETSTEVAERWLGQAVVDAYETGWHRNHDAASGTTVPGSAPAPSTSEAPNPSTFTYSGPTRKVLVLGDESTKPLADGLAAFGTETGALEVTSITPPCGILAATERDERGTRGPVPEECKDAVYFWLQAAVNTAPDIVLVAPGVWDLTDQVLAGDTTYRGLGDPAFDQALVDQYAKLNTALHKAAPLVAWLTLPPVDWGRNDPRPDPPFAANDPGRLTALNQVVRNMPTSIPPGELWSVNVDLAKHLAEDGGADTDYSLRPDGLAFTPEAARAVADWLGPELLTKELEFQANGK